MIDASTRALVPNDVVWEELVELAKEHDIELLGREGGFYGVLLKNHPLPEGMYTIQTNGDGPPKPGCVDVLLRIPEAYPHAAPDMFWIHPFVVLASSNARPGNADQFETYHGKSWQRFSWHIVGNKWRPIADTIPHTFIPFIDRRLWRGS